MTTSILARLQPLPIAAQSTPSPLAAKLSALPQEVQNDIVDQLRPDAEMSLECSYTAEPAFWKQAMFSVNWLWDLDQQEVASKESSKPCKSDWDWELLLRELCQNAFFESGKFLSDLSSGLRNRRRIWQLVMDMRIGDAQPDPFMKQFQTAVKTATDHDQLMISSTTLHQAD